MSELGLEFDDGYLMMDQWVEAGWVAPAAVPPTAALNEKLDEMSGEGNAALWTREALDQHEATGPRLGHGRSLHLCVTLNA